MATVVIAEDDADLLAVFVRVLTRAGHRVIACPDGGSALAKVRADRPDLVLTDVDMPPGISGLELIAAIRSDPEVTGVPVIVATGGGVCAEMAEAVGATLLLHKPLSPRALATHVETVLTGNAGTTSAPAAA
ncbi:response regulator [Planosporangium mesophilum]|uniref:Response regulatory domain-containing protein n=1 Tax=Planosporangium mesophilum TaxID=689768 RepID=A0A8J3TCX1_9ACTN|nr:response regulator [Planosporangium mesophilum]NJC82406.1 response regulator [Planosporangium mesophilum]GII24850.1 hypothetical protein Pme01_44470 [Planosporangium mesophilum]